MRCTASKRGKRNPPNGLNCTKPRASSAVARRILEKKNSSACMQFQKPRGRSWAHCCTGPVTGRKSQKYIQNDPASWRVGWGGGTPTSLNSASGDTTLLVWQRWYWGSSGGPWEILPLGLLLRRQKRVTKEMRQEGHLTIGWRSRKTLPAGQKEARIEGQHSPGPEEILGPETSKPKNLWTELQLGENKSAARNARAAWPGRVHQRRGIEAIEKQLKESAKIDDQTATAGEHDTTPSREIPKHQGRN